MMQGVLRTNGFNIGSRSGFGVSISQVMCKVKLCMKYLCQIEIHQNENFLFIFVAALTPIALTMYSYINNYLHKYPAKFQFKANAPKII